MAQFGTITMWYLNYKNLLFTYNAQIPGVKFDCPATGLKLLSAYTQIV